MGAEEIAAETLGDRMEVGAWTGGWRGIFEEGPQ